MADGRVYITDYVTNQRIEADILGNHLSKTLHEDIEILLVWHETIDAEFMCRLKNLKAVIRYGVGFDNIDMVYAKDHKITVCNTPDYGVDEVSNTAIGMLLAITRGIIQYDSQCRTYTDVWQDNTITGIKRASSIVLGVMGSGRIGSSVILKANALGFNTCIYDPYKERGYEKVINTCRYDTLDELLEESDVISIHTPLTDETLGLVDSSFVAKMKEGASIINTARGKIVSDLDIFYDHLKTGRISSIGLDVLPDEPPKESRLLDSWRNREKWTEGKVIINPHTAYYSLEAYKEMREKAALNALRVIQNMTPFNIL